MQNRPTSNNTGGIIALCGLIILTAGLIVILMLPEMKTGGWGILGVGLIVLVIGVIIDFRRVQKAVSGRRGKFGISTGVMSFIFIGITVFANALSVGNYHRFDTSSLSQFTLTPQTVKVLENIEQPIKIINFFDPKDTYNVDNYISSLLSEYANHTNKITIQRIDADTHPDQARKYGITMYQTVAFECGERRAIVPPTKFIEFDDSGNVKNLQCEHAFTSAILQVTGEAQKKVYFLTGHGEAGIESSYSKAKNGLLDDLFLVEELNLITNPQIPDDCAGLIIAAPQTSLTKDEVLIITEYLLNGGQLMILTNPNTIPELKPLVSLYGVTIGEGVIIDPSSSYLSHKDIPVVTYSRNYFYLPSVYFPNATAIIINENPPSYIVGINPLAWTSNSAWLDKNFSPEVDPVFDKETEKMEPMAIGVMIAANPVTGSGKKMTRLIIIGDSDFCSNEHYDNANNADLFLNSVNWLTEETSLISIRRNVQPFRRLVVTDNQSNFIKYSSIGIMPAIMLVIAGIVWWKRR